MDWKTRIRSARGPATDEEVLEELALHGRPHRIEDRDRRPPPRTGAQDALPRDGGLRAAERGERVPDLPGGAGLPREERHAAVGRHAPEPQPRPVRELRVDEPPREIVFDGTFVGVERERVHRDCRRQAAVPSATKLRFFPASFAR